MFENTLMYGTDETNISKADCYKWSEVQNFDSVCVSEKVEINNGTGVTFANKCGEILYNISPTEKESSCTGYKEMYLCLKIIRYVTCRTSEKNIGFILS